ncbi:hypothetical protein C8R45DRAFT_1219501 [Mycena sanguinolenta]|nr:hypothetical protein C8R45DRAFT_1219501 [Mycena sanguinolenta]
MATASSFSVRAILEPRLEQAREYSKTELERCVEESEMKLKSLETQLELRAVVAVMKYLFSPIHGIPAGLLAEIFERAIDEETHIMDVFRVSQVCSDWRQVAHNTPRLWTGPLEVTLDNRGHKLEQPCTDGFMEWLARSAALTIPITLTLDSHPTDICHDLLGGASENRLSMAFFARGLDSLEELNLGRIEFLKPLGAVFPSFTIAPRLRKLSMSISSSLLILVPWANLTELVLRCEYPDVALAALGPCANLVRGSIRTSGWHSSVLPRVDTLALTTSSFALFWDTRHCAPFFGSLSAPALQRVCMNFTKMVTTEHWMEAHCTAFQLQAPNITTLELLYADLSTDDFTPALLHAPSLTHLELFRWSCFDEGAITALRYEDGMTPLLPRMHHLVLEGMVHDLSHNIATRRWTDAALVRSRLPSLVGHASNFRTTSVNILL